MTERKYPFVVNNESSEAAIETALGGLRKMVGLGKRAQEALDSLQRDGHYDDEVVWIDNGRHVKRSRFPLYTTVSKADAPFLSALSIVIDEEGHTHRNGGLFRTYQVTTYPLTLRGPGVAYTATGFDNIDVNTYVGTIRVTSHRISYITNNRAYLITTRMKNLQPMLDKARHCKALSRVAYAVANAAVVGRAPSQMGSDLWKGVEKWLVEDGHVQRMLQEVIKNLHVKMVMDC